MRVIQFRSRFQTLTQNPLVADVVAAALVATASALKDANKARRLAESAGEELEALSRKSAERGNAMWELALDIGRQALDTLSEKPAKRTPAKKPAASKKPAAAKKPAATKKRATAKKGAGAGRKSK